MELLIGLYLFLLGTVFGSFAGAAAWRIEKSRDIVRERSECEHCHHTLAWYDLLPLISWLSLGGKCRYCKKPIGYSAIMLELSLGTAFLLSYVFWPGGFQSMYDWLIFGVWLMALIMLVVLFIYDLRHYLLPDVVMWPLVATGVIIFILRAAEGSWGASLVATELILSLLAVSGLYGALYWYSKGTWVGFGDVKLGLFMGLALGWQFALLAVFLANLIGCLVILPGLLRKKLSATSKVPFGPFLILGTFISFLFGAQLINAYMSLLIS